MRINREEVFGPVAAVIRVKDYDEALRVANDSACGLSWRDLHDPRAISSATPRRAS